MPRRPVPTVRRSLTRSSPRTRKYCRDSSASFARTAKSIFRLRRRNSVRTSSRRPCPRPAWAVSALHLASRTSRRRAYIHFDRVDNTVILRWPNTYAMVDANSPQAVGAKAVASELGHRGRRRSLRSRQPRSSSQPMRFSGDVADLRAQFDAVASKPEHDYKLDCGRSFFIRRESLSKKHDLAGEPNVGDRFARHDRQAPDPAASRSR